MPTKAAIARKPVPASRNTGAPGVPGAVVTGRTRAGSGSRNQAATRFAAASAAATYAEAEKPHGASAAPSAGPITKASPMDIPILAIAAVRRSAGTASAR